MRQQRQNNFIYTLKICIEGFGAPKIYEGTFQACKKEYESVKKKIKSDKTKWLEFKNPMPILIDKNKVVSLVIDEELNTPKGPHESQYYNGFFDNSQQVQNMVDEGPDVLDKGYK